MTEKLKEVHNLVWIDGESIDNVIKILKEESEGLQDPRLEISAYGEDHYDVHVCGYVNKTEYEIKKALEEAERVARETERHERTELARLKAKYE